MTVVPAQGSTPRGTGSQLLAGRDGLLAGTIGGGPGEAQALVLAAEEGSPVQEAVRTGGSTDGAPIHLSSSGVPVIVIGVPVRYAHTHYGISAYADFDNAVRLACALLKRLDADRIAGF